MFSNHWKNRVVKGFKRLIGVLFALLMLPAAGADVYSTGPAPGGTSVLSRIAFGSCLHQDRPQPIWEAVAAARPELFLLIGDSICLDTTDAAEKVTAYAAQAAQPGFQKLAGTCPVWGTWDDHDYGVNDAGADYPDRDVSQKAFLDFLKEAESSPRRRRDGVYDARVYGPPGREVQIILLDTRYFRSPLTRRAERPEGEGPYEATTNRTDTLLGAEQWAWFRQQLRVPARLRIIVSSIQVLAQDHHWEKWMNFPHERRMLFNMISDTEADGVVFLSGDRHQAELSTMDGAPRAMDASLGYPLYDLTSSSLNLPMQEPLALYPCSAHGTGLAEINRCRISDVFHGSNFGLVTIDWEQADPLITLEVRDEAGASRIRHETRLSALRAPGHELL